MAPLLSIVCPFYGVEAYLAECLDSLQNQTFTDFEVIMVDDGSPDNCRVIAESIARSDDRFKLVVQQNAGLGPARNTGIKHATGRYLTFVDSDDVVPPRAYELMVTTLERTGSDFAAGNARRFGGKPGLRQSWTHRIAFATNRLGTQIRQFPELIADRMVWNKVYRRSFWDQHGYEFPAIRYEDYPVTLAAHLDATSVDVISNPIYLWRERDSNDSITQMTANLDNAKDRVASALMVLELVDPSLEQRIAQRVHAYLADIDLIALAGALLKAPAEDRPEFQRLISSLVERLDISGGGTQRLTRLIYAAVEQADFRSVEAFANWRANGDTKALFKQMGRNLSAQQWKEIRKAVLQPRKLPKVLAGPKQLKSEVSQITAGEQGFRVQGNIKLNQLFTKLAKVTTTLSGSGNAVELPIKLLPQGHGYHFDLLVPYDVIERFGSERKLDSTEQRQQVIGQCAIQFDIRLGALRWSGQPRLLTKAILPITRTPSGSWVQVSQRSASWALWFWLVRNPVFVAQTELDETALILNWSVPTGEVVLAMPNPSPDRRYSIVNSVSRIDLAELVATDPLDDPVAKTGWRQLKVLQEDRELWPFMTCEPVQVELTGRSVAFTPSRLGRAELSYGP